MDNSTEDWVFSLTSCYAARLILRRPDITGIDLNVVVHLVFLVNVARLLWAAFRAKMLRNILEVEA